MDESGGASPAFVPGRKLGPYTLLERMGAGGLGEVWKARDGRLNRIVALKFITAERQGAASPRELLREARAASALNHPNIITIFEVGEGETGAYLAMEFVEGETLRARLKRPPVPLEEALEIAEQVLNGLAAAHRQGIVHRDLKPENIMLRVDGYVKLVDFGLAKVLPWAEAGAESTAGSTPTLSGQIVGTFTYMSPEQSRGQPVTPASDVFSFGIVLYELITSEHPFRGATTMDTLSAILHKEASPAAERSGSVSREISDVIGRALCKEASGRFSNAADMAAELRRARERSAPARPAEPAVRPRSRLAQVIGIVLLLLLIAATAIYMRPRAGFGPGDAPRVGSVAILAFGAGDPPSQGLAQGLPDELGTALAGSGIAVAPRASVRSLAGASDARSIGLQLGVDAVLEGSVRSYGNKLKVHAELVSVRTGFQVWSGSVTVDAVDALAAEQQAARDIARQLREALARGR